jgi:hypothetical protein
MQPLKTDLFTSLVRQQSVVPMSKIGFIQMKLRSDLISGDVASFAWSIVTGKIHRLRKVARLFAPPPFAAIRIRFKDGRLMLTPRTLKPSPAQGSQLFRCPGCNEIVDGNQLSELLLHHQHLLDFYRLKMMRELNAAQARPTTEGLIGVRRPLPPRLH